MSSDGTIYAIHDDELVIVRGTAITTRPMKGARRIVADGRTVAVLTEDAMAVSNDGGATFASRAIPPPCEGCEHEVIGSFDMTITGGSPFLVETSINTCTSFDILEWQRLVQFGATPFQRSIVVPRADMAATWHFGAFGWMYGVTYAHRLLAVSAGGFTPVEGIAPLAKDNEFGNVAHNQRVTVATIGDALVELNGARARVLDAHVKPGDSLAVDGDDRPLVSDGKELWRFSRITGWTKLALTLRLERLARRGVVDGAGEAAGEDALRDEVGLGLREARVRRAIADDVLGRDDDVQFGAALHAERDQGPRDEDATAALGDDVRGLERGRRSIHGRLAARRDRIGHERLRPPHFVHDRVVRVRVVDDDRRRVVASTPRTRR